MVDAGRYDKAVIAYRQGLVRLARLDPRLYPDPHQPWPNDVWIGLALADACRGDFARTELFCRRVLRRDDHSWWAHLYLGISLLQQGKPAAAERALDRAIAIEPKCLWAWEQLGRVHAMRGAYDRAAQAAARSLAIAPHQPHLIAALKAFKARARLAPGTQTGSPDVPSPKSR